MPLTTSVQFNIILYALISGVLTGGMFDLYRIIRGVKVPKLVTVIQDILFWILAAMIVFCFLLYTNQAFLGTYVYIFMFISLVIYFKVISPTFIKIEFKVISILSKALRILLKNIIYPFKIVFYNIMGKNN